MSNPTPHKCRLPANGFSRLRQIVPEILPISRSTFWRLVKRGDFPQPVKIGKRITAWRNEDITAWEDAQH